MVAARRNNLPAEIPPELRRWNWGAFLLNWIWGVCNGTYIALLALVPIVGLVMLFVLGAKGSAWAWRDGHWDSVEHFKRVQRLWATWGVVAWLGVIALVGGLFGEIFYTLSHSEAYRLAVARLEASAEVTEALGAPLAPGYPIGGVMTSTPIGSAGLFFRVSGPKGAGLAIATAGERDGVWSLRTLVLKIDGGKRAIDVMKANSSMLDKGPTSPALPPFAAPVAPS